MLWNVNSSVEKQRKVANRMAKISIVENNQPLFGKKELFFYWDLRLTMHVVGMMHTYCTTVRSLPLLALLSTFIFVHSIRAMSSFLQYFQAVICCRSQLMCTHVNHYYANTPSYCQ